MLSDLFKTILNTFADTDAFIKADSPTFFLIYAHDNTSIGNANAALARDLISWLEILRAKVISDRSLSLGPWTTREDTRTVQDILANQFCLLPKSDNNGRSDIIGKVDKIILCCSEVLQSYCNSKSTQAYTQAIKNLYTSSNRDPRSTAEFKRGLEEIVRANQYEGWFHHVLTELAFVDIRCDQEETHQSIIPVVFNGDGIKSLPFISKGVPLWLKLQGQTENIIHPCQAVHRLLFNLLRQIYTDKHLAISEFNKCYDICARMLSAGSSLPSLEKFEWMVSKEIKLTVDRLTGHGLAASRAGKFNPFVNLIPADFVL